MFSPPPVFSPTADQKKHWICLASRNYEESYNDDCIAAILLDGLFVQGQEGALTAEDIQEYTLNVILSSCIDALDNSDEPTPFQFRECNIHRVLAYFNQLKLHADLLAHIPMLERYKMSLLIYHVITISPHGKCFDELMTSSDDPDDAERLLNDKRSFEKQILENIKSSLTIIDSDFVLI